ECRHYKRSVSCQDEPKASPTYRSSHLNEKRSRHNDKNMNTIAVITICLVTTVVSAQDYRYPGGADELRECPSHFCETAQCGMFATVADYNGARCRCPCFGFGGDSDGNRIANCPASFCYNGQCDEFDSFSYHLNKLCSCQCSGNGGYGGIIQN
ncbi:hypothetical protein ACJMK2_020741, partial [Sinanodonta woodiana]